MKKLIVALFLCWPSIALAQPAVGLAAGTEHGFGGVARLGPKGLSLDVGLGVVPFIVIDLDLGVHTAVAPRIDAGPVLFLSDGRFRNGLHLAGFFDGISGPGAQAGYVGSFGLKSSRLEAGAGLRVTPMAPDRIAERFDLARGDLEEISWALYMGGPYIGASIIWGAK